MRAVAWGLVLLLLAGDEAARYRISTVAGNGRAELGAMRGSVGEVAIAQPFGVELGPGGALFVCEVGNHRVLRVDLPGRRVETVVGTGKKGYSGDGGPAVEATLNEPYELRFDGGGNLYVVEMRNAVVRRVDASTQRIRTIAGTGVPGYSGDGGPAVRAQLRQPHSIALDGKGGLYIADIGNQRIRRVDLETGDISTIVGNGERAGPAEGPASPEQPILGPRALHITGETLWIALREGHSVWRMDLGRQELAHIAGDGTGGFRDGHGRGARFDGPKGIVATVDGWLYVVDTENHAIRAVDPLTGEVRTVAGSGPDGGGFGGEGGPALEAKLDRPHGIAADSRGRLFVGDTNNHRVRVLERVGQ